MPKCLRVLLLVVVCFAHVMGCSTDQDSPKPKEPTSTDQGSAKPKGASGKHTTKPADMKEVTASQVNVPSPISAGPYQFEVASAEVTQKRLHTIKVPGGERTLKAEGKDEVIVLITVALNRSRGYTAKEKGALQSHTHAEAYKLGMTFFGTDMVVSNDMFRLAWAKEDKANGRTMVGISKCLMDARFHYGALSMNSVKADAQKIRCNLAFTFNSTVDRALLLFFPVPGDKECKAAALVLSGGRLSPVEYGDSKVISKKYFPKALWRR